MRARLIEDQLGHGRRKVALALFIIDALEHGDPDLPALLEQARELSRELLEDSLAQVDDRYLRRTLDGGEDEEVQP